MTLPAQHRLHLVGMAVGGPVCTGLLYAALSSQAGGEPAARLAASCSAAPSESAAGHRLGQSLVHLERAATHWSGAPGESGVRAACEVLSSTQGCLELSVRLVRGDTLSIDASYPGLPNAFCWMEGSCPTETTTYFDSIRPHLEALAGALSRERLAEIYQVDRAECFAVEHVGTGTPGGKRTAFPPMSRLGFLRCNGQIADTLPPAERNACLRGAYLALRQGFNDEQTTLTGRIVTQSDGRIANVSDNDIDLRHRHGIVVTLRQTSTALRAALQESWGGEIDNR